ncbi:MAG: tRNA pseudouridine(55) synthase TruB, partial [Silvibacterium sp.]
MNGLLILDKPAGMTSHDVVARVRRATGESSIGHLGTLDPMATGVLPLLLGKFTRLAQFYGAHEKAYTGTIRFGFSTDTYDAEGTPASAAVAPSLTLDAVRVAAAVFSGEVEQMPPPVSAKKIGGKPAYKIARAGGVPKLKTARITIAEFSILSLDGDVAGFAMRVSAGGYVRSVAHEMGQALGCGAHLAS